MSRRDDNDTARSRSLLSRRETDHARGTDALSERPERHESLLSLRSGDRSDRLSADGFDAAWPPVRPPRRRRFSLSAGDRDKLSQAMQRGNDTGTPPRPPAGPSGGGQQEPWQPLVHPMAVVGGILRSGRIVVATTLAGAALGVLVALGTPKHYISTAEVIVDPRDIKIGDRDLTAGGLPSDATLAIIENQVRVMYSGKVLGDVVTALDLADDSEFNGQAGGFSFRGLVSDLKSLLREGGGVADTDRARALAVENLAESLEISRGDKTFVIYVSARTKDPEKSARIANTVVEVFRQVAGSIQSDTAGRAETEITSRLAELRQGVLDGEKAVEEFKAANDLVDAQGRLITDDQIVKLNDQLSVARAKTIELQARASSARDVDPDAAVSASLPEYVNSAVLSELRSQYARLAQQADALAVRLGPRHPERQAVEAQLAGARRQIAAELRRIVSSIQVDLKRAVEQEQQLSARLAQAKALQADVSGRLVELRELEREVAAQRAVYENYLLRARDVAEQKGFNTANVSLISPATPALLPTGPSRATIAILFTVFGFLAGVGIGILRGIFAALGGRNAMATAFRQHGRPESGGEPVTAEPSPPHGPLPPAGRRGTGRLQEPDAPAGRSMHHAGGPAGAAAMMPGSGHGGAPAEAASQPQLHAGTGPHGQAGMMQPPHWPQQPPHWPQQPPLAYAPGSGSPTVPVPGWLPDPRYGPAPVAPAPAQHGLWSGAPHPWMAPAAAPVMPAGYWPWTPQWAPPVAPPVQFAPQPVYHASAMPGSDPHDAGGDPAVDAEVRALRSALRSLRDRVERASSGRRRAS
ncbi:GumC family protein [Zhengella sp. ZM62]|uniref:GumC family protein n=1 Tax=Zhengella sedimenti TaxID=3390035 RepID=UPI003974DBA2